MLVRFSWLPLLAVCLLAAAGPALAQPADLRTRLDRLSPSQRDDVLWLARCVYSESDRAHEQRLVAWVVRNRVETGYRGATYQQVVLEPRQFSAFNRTSPQRRKLLRLHFTTPSRAWHQALRAALDVYRAPAAQRPFPRTTRHFYSPVSMRGRRVPAWAVGEQALPSQRLGVDPHRFQFFAGLDEGAATVAEADGGTVSPKGLVYHRRLQSRRLSGRVARPVRPHLARRSRQR